MEAYRGYQGSINYSGEDRCYFGKLLGVRDLVTYEAPTEETLMDAFRKAVDDYLALCAKLGRVPEVPVLTKPVVPQLKLVV